LIDDDYIQFGGGGGGQQRPPTDFYQLNSISRILVKRFNSEATSLVISFRNIDQFSLQTTDDIFNHLLKSQLARFKPSDRFGIEIFQRHLDRSALVPFTPVSEISASKILSIMERIQQSKKEFSLSEDMLIKLIVVKDVRGAGGKTRCEGSLTKIVNWDEWYSRHTKPGGAILKVKP